MCVCERKRDNYTCVRRKRRAIHHQGYIAAGFINSINRYIRKFLLPQSEVGDIVGAAYGSQSMTRERERERAAVRWEWENKNEEEGLVQIIPLLAEGSHSGDPFGRRIHQLTLTCQARGAWNIFKKKKKERKTKCIFSRPAVTSVKRSECTFTRYVVLGRYISPLAACFNDVYFLDADFVIVTRRGLTDDDDDDGILVHGWWERKRDFYVLQFNVPLTLQWLEVFPWNNMKSVA